MNRLILIGNGFDLAHGMKTSYNDFILWYLKKCFTEAFEKGKYDDKLIAINSSSYYTHWRNTPIEDFIKFLEHYFKNNIYDLFRDQSIFLNSSSGSYNPFTTIVKSELLNQLLSKCLHSNWVDIENEFYIRLKASLPGVNDHTDHKIKQLQSLNQSMRIIIDELENFLSSLEPSKPIPDYSRIFDTYIKARDICIKKISKDEKAQNTLILNFNYTDTPEQYLADELFFTKMNYIHGKVGINNNPLIFGFGDELDKNYEEMELQKSNEFFEYIKSFWYFKTSNYHDLVRFIEDDEFQVYILGHSCGLSDRTMLNMIFEHEKCISIKMFYHEKEDGTNNYTSLTQEISRHFSLKNKGIMRKKIVPFTMSEKMPQVKLQ